MLLLAVGCAARPPAKASSPPLVAPADPPAAAERSIRFALWNNEETRLSGARAYVEQRKALQRIESPAGSGQYPEPKWLRMIQHDMMLLDHGVRSRMEPFPRSSGRKPM